MKIDNRLLLLGCSRRKRIDTGTLPALERYDGPAFRVVRRALRHGAPLPTTLVLSAEYGLIPAQQPIPAYDRPMSPGRAEELAAAVPRSLQQYLTEPYAENEIFVCMGKRYLPILSSVLRGTKVPIIYASGSIGRQISLLKRWLCPNEPFNTGPHDAGQITLKGRIVENSAEEVLCLARNRAAKDPTGVRRYKTWYVAAGELRVAPKWLVSQLTGVPVGNFRTADALQVLTSLGVEVRRT